MRASTSRVASTGDAAPLRYSASRVVAVQSASWLGMADGMADGMPDTKLRINAICPGGVDTAIVPDALRAGDIEVMTPDELAREVLDLLEQGKSGEIRVKLAAGVPAYAVPPTHLG